MGAFAGEKFVTGGLITLIDPANTKFNTVASPKNMINLSSSAIGTGTGFSLTGSTATNILRSDADTVTGAGTAMINMPTAGFTTGSGTIFGWLNRTSDAHVGVNNNYRLVWTFGGNLSPFGVLMEYSGLLNFTTNTTTVGSRRYLNSTWGHITLGLNSWTCAAYTYDKTTGTASCYLNGVLQATGFMSNAAGASPTSAGEGLITTTTQFRLSTTNTTPDPSAGCFNGDMGLVGLYNVALDSSQIASNFYATRGRYGV